MPTVRKNPDTVQLGEFLFDQASGLLIHSNGDQQFLRPQTAEVLKMLCDATGQLVTRDDLISAIWPDLNVTDDSLTQCIAEIRRALGDRNRTVVKTVPKKGFILHTSTTLIASVSSDMPMHQAGRKTSAALVDICFALPETADPALLDRLEKSLDGRSPKPVLNRQENSLTLTGQGVSEAVSLCLSSLRNNHLKAGVQITGNAFVSPRALARIAEPGQILASVDVRDSALSDPSFEFRDLGDCFVSGTMARVFHAIPRPNLPLSKPLTSKQDVRPTLAVLPLRDVVEEGSPMLGEFIAGEITSSLSRSGDVNVISRLSCASFVSGQTGLSTIARQLGANFVISGRYHSKGRRLVVDLELASPETQHILWADRFEADPTDLFNGFGALKDVVGHVCRAIVLNEIKNVQAQRPETLHNYSVLFGAVGLMHRLSPRDFEHSKLLLEDLSDRLPHQASPLAWLARWYVLRVMQGWSENPVADANTALASASRALEIDPENVLALTSTGFVMTNLLKRLDNAEDTYLHALDINPNDPHGRALLGMLHAFQDRGADAVRETERALHLTPLDPHRFFFLALAAGASLTAEDYDRTLELTSASLRLNRTHVSTLRMLVATHVLAGDTKTGRKKANELMSLQPNLRVGQWLESSPSADFEVGRRIANALRTAGIPE